MTDIETLEPVAFMDVCEKGQKSGLRFWSEPENRHEVALYTAYKMADIETLELENRLLRARNERLERITGEIVARLEQGFGASHAAPLLIRREFIDAVTEVKR